jgi:hypothetical protein
MNNIFRHFTLDEILIIAGLFAAKEVVKLSARYG